MYIFNVTSFEVGKRTKILRRRGGVVAVLQKMKRKQDYVFEGGMKLPACTQNAGRYKSLDLIRRLKCLTKFYVSPTREGGWLVEYDDGGG